MFKVQQQVDLGHLYLGKESSDWIGWTLRCQMLLYFHWLLICDEHTERNVTALSGAKACRPKNFIHIHYIHFNLTTLSWIFLLPLHNFTADHNNLQNLDILVSHSRALYLVVPGSPKATPRKGDCLPHSHREPHEPTRSTSHRRLCGYAIKLAIMADSKGLEEIPEGQSMQWLVSSLCYSLNVD